MYRLIWLILLLFLSRLAAQSPAQHNSYRDRWQQPQRILDSIAVKQGMTIGEAGAGEGYFTIKLAERVGPTGLIYANDIDKQKLEELENYCRNYHIDHIVPVIGAIEDPLFPSDQLDMVVMMCVFHDLQKPVSFLKNIKKYLKNGASVVIIDRDPAKFNRYSSHFMPKAEVIENIEAANYQLLRMYTFLARDNIYVCSPLAQSPYQNDR